MRRKVIPRRRTKVFFPPRSQGSSTPQQQHVVAPTIGAATRVHSSSTRSRKSVVGRDEMSFEVTEAPISMRAGVPPLFAEPPPVKDDLITESSTIQDATVDECVILLAGTLPGKSGFDYTRTGVPSLERENHVDFLKEHLEDARILGYDSARPWIVYWCLAGLCLLGEDVSEYRQRVVETFIPAQNPNGGFGGGHGHTSHCAPSYAVVLSLAMVGGKEAYDLIDRKSLWRWLGRVKQTDGGFSMCEGGEEDVRGLYCSLVMIALLAIPLELPPDAPARRSGLSSLLDGVPEYISRCQTYEGGISGAPQTEAHGAYAFCVLGSLCILGSPQDMIPRYLDLPALMSWLSARQYAPEGGFSGRTNKLVDGCYSHWVGGCWPLIEAAVSSTSSSGLVDRNCTPSLYSRGGLIRYILSCCQDELGGLRDKPSARPDAYHTCYVLAGLSSAQFDNAYEATSAITTANGLDAPFKWRSQSRQQDSDADTASTYDDTDMVESLHPVFAIPWDAVKNSHAYFNSKVGF